MPSPVPTTPPSPQPTPVPTSNPSYACEAGDEYRYKLIMTDSGGDGWGGVQYTITTESATEFTGTLDGSSTGVKYFCIEDGSHSFIITDRCVASQPVEHNTRVCPFAPR